MLQLLLLVEAAHVARLLRHDVALLRALPLQGRARRRLVQVAAVPANGLVRAPVLLDASTGSLRNPLVR